MYNIIYNWIKKEEGRREKEKNRDETNYHQ